MNEQEMIPWTTARCKELLEPIESRIKILRNAANTKGCLLKEHEEIDRRPIVQDAFKPSVSHGTTLATPGKQANSDWMNKPTRKKTTKRFKRRQDIGSSSKDLNDERPLHCAQYEPPASVTLPTPYLVKRNARWSTNQQSPSSAIAQTSRMNSSGATTCSSSTTTKPANRSQEPHEPRPRHTISDDKLFEDLLNAFEDLLRATLWENTTHVGARASLFATCLRQVPKAITLEQQCLRDEYPNDNEAIDAISDGMYTDLEGLATSGTGWPHLREVVRAHAVNIVSEAIIERLIPHKIYRPLFYIRYSLEDDFISLAERKTLFSAMLQELQIYPMVRSISEQQASSWSHTYAYGDWNLPRLLLLPIWTYNYTFVFHQLAQLVDTGVLPLTTFLQPAWSDLISRAASAISPFNLIQGSYVAATELLSAIVQKLHAIRDQEPWHSKRRLTPMADTHTHSADIKIEQIDADMCSIVGSITVLAIIDGLSVDTTEFEDAKAPKKASWVLQMIAQDLEHPDSGQYCRDCYSQPQSAPLQNSIAVMDVLMGNLLDMLIAPKSSEDKFARASVDILIRRLRLISRGRDRSSRTQTVFTLYSEFLVVVAAKCGIFTKDDGLRHLGTIIEALLESSEHQQAPEAAFMQHIALESADVFARLRPQSDTTSLSAMLRDSIGPRTMKDLFNICAHYDPCPACAEQEQIPLR